MLHSVIVAARPVEEPAAAVDAAIGQVEPKVGRQGAPRTHPVLRRNFGRVLQLESRS